MLQDTKAVLVNVPSSPFTQSPFQKIFASRLLSAIRHAGPGVAGIGTGQDGYAEGKHDKMLLSSAYAEMFHEMHKTTGLFPAKSYELPTLTLRTLAHLQTQMEFMLERTMNNPPTNRGDQDFVAAFCAVFIQQAQQLEEHFVIKSILDEKDQYREAEAHLSSLDEALLQRSFLEEYQKAKANKAVSQTQAMDS